MSIRNTIEEFNEMFYTQLLESMKLVSAEQLGLDPRAASCLWVDDDCIVVEKQQDRSLQYYGGFEYVDKECRTEVGDYVVYFAENNRVRGHLDRLSLEYE